MPRLKIRLTPAAERAVRNGHPWVFADRIKSTNRDADAGEIAVVYDRNDRFLALGLFDPLSPIRLRILHAGKPVTADDEWWRQRMTETTGARQFNERTTGYRWINGESDGWPGLVLDRYGNTAVVKIYTAAWLPWLDSIREWIVSCCAPAPTRIVLRLSRNIVDHAATMFGKKDGDMLLGDAPETATIFLEAGLKFEADVIRGQKTGFFLDQRENRRRVAGMAKDADLLNVFSHAGGFSVHAAAAGAKSATDLDISAHALESAKRNMALNADQPAVTRCRHETIKADAFDWLTNADRKWFDIIVIDPPSMAKRQDEVTGALSAYERLATLGFRRLRPGGFLVAASCSAHVTAADFFQTIRQCASRLRAGFREIATTEHPPDHPARILEAHYLKCMFIRKL